MRTEVKLDNSYYKLLRLPTQTLANQMANKVGQGTSQYGDLTTWSAWIQDDWQEGVGNLRPGINGGFLYGEVESRVPNQLVLPQKLSPSDTLAQPGYDRQHHIDSNSTFKVMANNDAVAIPFKPATTPATATRFYIHCSFDNFAGGTLRFELRNATGATEGSQITAANLVANSVTPGYYWYGVALSTSALVAGTTYWLKMVNQTGGTVTLAGADSSSVYPNVSYYRIGAAGAWASLGTTIKPYWLSGLENIDTGNTLGGNGLFRFNGKLYCYTNKKTFKWDNVDKWSSVGTITGITGVTGATVFADKVYFGNAKDDLDYTTMSTLEAFVDTGQDGKIFLSYNGFLYRARVNTVEYSDDGTIWQPTTTFGKPITVSETSDPITGMCGMGENIYVSTTKGLVAIYPGAIARSVMPWGSTAPQNGVRMKNFQGALYITVGGRVVRFTEDGSQQDVWMTRDDDLITNRIGRVIDLEVMNNWLLALVVSSEYVNGNPTIWAYQNSKWHHVATLPCSTTTSNDIVLDYDMYYDRNTSRLWVITMDAMVYYWNISDYSLNPINDPRSLFCLTGWVEWDWFNGPILEAPKDYESIAIIGENFSPTCYVKAYWKDDTSTNWEFLGTFDNNIEEIRWTLASGQRPNTKRFKLGLLLFCPTFMESPRIRAIRVKYNVMVKDWFRWNLVLDVAGRTGAFQMTQDGARNTLTASQIKDNISALCTRIPPFVYQDVDGKQYEVKVTDGNFQYTKNEYNELTGVGWWEGQYSLVLEQVTQGVFVP